MYVGALVFVTAKVTGIGTGTGTNNQQPTHNTHKQLCGGVRGVNNETTSRQPTHLHRYRYGYRYSHSLEGSAGRKGLVWYGMAWSGLVWGGVGEKDEADPVPVARGLRMEVGGLAASRQLGTETVKY